MKENEKTWLFEADISLVDKPENEEDTQNAIESKMMKRGLRRAQEYLWIDRVIPYEYTDEISGKLFLLSKNYRLLFGGLLQPMIF